MPGLRGVRGAPVSPRPVLGAVILLLVFTSAGPSQAGELTFRDAADGRFTLAQMLPRLRAARFLLLGEEHGSHRHHAAQVEMLRLLRDAGVPLVVGMETFSAAATPELGRWTAGELESAPFHRRFGAEWSLSNWPAYRDLFFFLRERRIPLAGINAEEALIQRVARGGIASLGREERRALPPGGCTVDPSYRALIERVVGPGMMHEGLFRTFCEAQSLRDAIMARNLDRLARDRPGRVVVGLLGNYHAWKPAVPAQLSRVGARDVLVILPDAGPPRTAADLAREADYLWRWRD